MDLTDGLDGNGRGGQSGRGAFGRCVILILLSLSEAREPTRQKMLVAPRITRYFTTDLGLIGLTIAEFIPRQVIRLQQVLGDFPLI